MVSDLLKGKTGLEKSLIKSQELGKLKNVKPYSRHGFDIEILEIGTEIGLLKVIVRAKKNGQYVFVDNPFYFVNPPILVPDGTKKTIVNRVGQVVQVDNFKEDLVEALKEIVAQTLKLTVK